MRLLKLYGRHAAVSLVVLGCVSLLLGSIGISEARTSLIWIENEGRFENSRWNDPLAANLLLNAGIPLFPQDAIFYIGVDIPPDFRLPENNPIVLTYKSALPVTLISGSDEIRFFSSAPSLGQALWEQGIILSAGDTLSLPVETALIEPLQVYLERGESVTITIGDQIIQFTTAAKTVGATLLEAGISLQGLDFSLPEDDQPIPENREIEVVRVREETLLEDTDIPFPVERVADVEMNVGEQKTLQAGQNGVLTSALRVRFENETETSRTNEYDWISRPPITQMIAYGGNVVVQTLPEGLNYWLAKEVKVLSYRDTGQPTATGIWPTYGTIAVSPEWFSILRGSNIFVPGYGVGTVLDVCPGCSGNDWIDVFIPTEEYVPWNKTLTVYFLTPIPSGFSGDLP